MICHVMDNLRNEVGSAKTKVYAQEFQWKKRMWPISKEAVAWKDKKGVSHMFFDVNESDGTIRFLEPIKFNYRGVDKCRKCGDRISIDARNTYDLLKRGTIKAIWGFDSSHITLLIIMGIMALGMLAGVFYLLGENRNLQGQLAKYLPASSATTKFILPLEALHYAS